MNHHSKFNDHEFEANPQSRASQRVDKVAGESWVSIADFLLTFQSARFRELENSRPDAPDVFSG